MSIYASHRMWIYFWMLAVCGLKVSDGSMKRWLPDTDWHNRLNWRDQRVPCSASEVALPQDVVLSIYVNGSVSWRTLLLPDNGELLLDDDWRLLDEEPCRSDEQQAAFVNWHPRSWFHPHHWAILDEGEAPLPSIQAVPHSDRIPCVTDVVLLPDRHGFSVDLLRFRSPLTVGALRFGQKEIRSAADFLAAPEMKFRIHNPPRSFYTNGTDCSDPLGCQCGNGASNVMQLICSYSGDLCADAFQCSDSFRPPGHCCHMCGALFQLTVDEQIFNKNSLDRLVASMSGPSGVSTYSYRSDRNILHLTVTDNSTNERSTRLAAKIFDYLKDESNRRMYGIVDVQLKLSGESHAASRPWTSDQLRLLVSNLMAVLCAGLLLTLAAVFYLSRSRSQLMDRLVAAVRRPADEQTVAFARFQNDGNVEIGIPESVLFQDPPSLACAESPAGIQESTVAGAADAVGDADAARDLVVAVESAPESGPSKSGAGAEIEAAESPDNVKRTGAWKKLTRAFVNPLFGHPSASGRLSGRWSMSSLIKSSATQENPIYDVAGGQPVDDRSIITAAQSASDHVVAGGQGALERSQQPVADSAQPVVAPAVESAAHPAAEPAQAADADELQVAESPEEQAARCSGVDPATKKAPLKPARQLATLWNRAKRQAAHSPEPKECADESVACQPEDEIQLTLAEETQDSA